MRDIGLLRTHNAQVLGSSPSPATRRRGSSVGRAGKNTLVNFLGESIWSVAKKELLRAGCGKLRRFAIKTLFLFFSLQFN